MSASRRIAAVVVAPLALGASVYVFLRPTEAWFVRALGETSLGTPLRHARAVTTPLAAYVPSIVLDVAPDLAWAFVVGALLGLVWRDHPRASRTAARAWLVAGLLATLGFEVAQRFHVVPGTFDPRDLVAQALGYAGGLAAAHSHFFARNHKRMTLATTTIKPSANG